MVGYCKHLVFACFADNFAFGNYALDISCSDNCLYNSYKSANSRNDSCIPD